MALDLLRRSDTPFLPRKVDGSYRFSSQKTQGTHIVHTPPGVHGLQVKKKHLGRNRDKIKSIGLQVSLAHSSTDRLQKHRTEDRNFIEESYTRSGREKNWKNKILEK